MVVSTNSLAATDNPIVYALTYKYNRLNVRELGFDERFRRIWTYYLAYCEAGFRTRAIDVVQTVLRPA